MTRTMHVPPFVEEILHAQGTLDLVPQVPGEELRGEDGLREAVMLCPGDVFSAVVEEHNSRRHGRDTVHWNLQQPGRQRPQLRHFTPLHNVAVLGAVLRGGGYVVARKHAGPHRAIHVTLYDFVHPERRDSHLNALGQSALDEGSEKFQVRDVLLEAAVGHVARVDSRPPGMYGEERQVEIPDHEGGEALARGRGEAAPLHGFCCDGCCVLN
eukprot:CAMPEP_0198680432 /NCGR_PEP_ID=MMETSP1468-20131203/4820_1 /TAXON_ID=1461545 /ORGANISM="Mantoniella sp, Strain CCMP1436" /LENGTH=211 /DNA_ID=CAMNT_0044420709 /DNA_START=125 /DNA_END=761 /DNA_ORIENTATION=+